jgi:hypothetical protein
MNICLANWTHVEGTLKVMIRHDAIVYLSLKTARLSTHVTWCYEVKSKVGPVF